MAAESAEAVQGPIEGGELLYAGGASWSCIGRGKKPAGWDGVEDDKITVFSRLKPLMGVHIRRVITGCMSNHILAITGDGKPLVWGRNEDGQLGLGDFRNRYHPTRVPDVATAATGCTGLGHTVIISRDHALYAAGRNDFGQCGVGRVSKHVTTFKPVAGAIVGVACSAGRNFTIVCDTAGRVYAMGCPQYGQLGNGTEGGMLEKAGKVTFRNESSPVRLVSPAILERQIVDVKCGASHTCAMDNEGRLLTWGFGGYGQLGHKSNKNELEPRPVEFFNNEAAVKPPGTPSFMWRQKPKMRAMKIACGASCTYAIANRQAMYMWGITKKSGESTMSPEIFTGLRGWKCRDVATGLSSTIVSSEKSVITWGPGPTWGELAYGPSGPKSSTTTRKADCIEGVTVSQVAMGANMSLVLVPPTPEHQEFLENAPVLDQPELPEAAGGGAKKKKKGRKSKASESESEPKAKKTKAKTTKKKKQ